MKHGESGGVSRIPRVVLYVALNGFFLPLSGRFF